MTARPEPSYYRRAVLEWCGGSRDATIRIEDGNRAPRLVNGDVVVGAGWLKRQAIPVGALATKAVIYSQDGDQRCATRPGFVDLHESPAGFGDTDAEALKDLEQNERKQ